MAEKKGLPQGTRGDLAEAVHYLSAVRLIVGGILAVEDDSLGQRGCETVWWLATKAEEKLDAALREIDSAADRIKGGRADA